MSGNLPDHGCKWKWSLGLLNAGVVTALGLLLLFWDFATIGRHERRPAREIARLEELDAESGLAEPAAA